MARKFVEIKWEIRRKKAFNWLILGLIKGALIMRVRRFYLADVREMTIRFVLTKFCLGH